MRPVELISVITLIITNTSLNNIIAYVEIFFKTCEMWICLDKLCISHFFTIQIIMVTRHILTYPKFALIHLNKFKKYPYSFYFSHCTLQIPNKRNQFFLLASLARFQTIATCSSLYTMVLSMTSLPCQFTQEGRKKKGTFYYRSALSILFPVVIHAQVFALPGSPFKSRYANR